MFKINLKLLIVSLSFLIAFPILATQPVKIVRDVNLKTTMPSVVKSEKLKSGHELQIVRLSDGSLSKRIVSENSNHMPATRMVPQYSSDVKYTAPFVEMFEGYDGETIDWIPEGWQDISKTDPPHVPPTEKALNFTWQVEGRGFDQALEGYYSARVQNSFYSNPENPQELINEPQDEWLITPTVSITENNVLYFYLGYRPGWVFINVDDWAFDQINNIMEVHISEDGGETWRMIWDCLDDAYSYSNAELLESLMSITVWWTPFRIDLSEYAGKDIKVAFRYVGNEGESMRIDAVSIKRPEPQAYYTMPAGAFYNGFAENFKQSPVKSLLYGAYADCTWLNYSNVECENFEWQYTDENGTQEITSDVDLTYYCKPGQYMMPTLMAFAQYADAVSYTMDAEYIQMGGNKVIDGQQYGACNYNIDNSIGAYEMDGIYIFGSGSNDLWTSWAATNKDQEVELAAVANYFEKPNHSYYFTKVWVNAILDATTDVKFKLEALNVENGSIDPEPFATATCTANDITFTTVDGNKYATILFDFGKPVTVENGMMLKLSGFSNNASVKEFAVLNQYYPNTDGVNYAYGFLNIREGEEETETLMPASSITTALGSLNTAFCFIIDAEFTWLECNNADIYASYEGSSKGLKFMTDFKTEDFVVEGEGVGEWITYTLGAYDEDAKTQLITFTVAENLEDARSSEVRVKVPGSVKLVNISQDKHPDYDGVDEIVTTSNAAMMIGGNLVVKTFAGEPVKVYNSQGMQVYSQIAAEKEIVIDMANCPNGIYFVRFENSEVVKVIK